MGKPSIQIFDVGKWVCWYSPEGFMSIGKIIGEPGSNRNGETTYPIELLSGVKTAAVGTKLQLMPRLHRGIMSNSRRDQLLEECNQYNLDVANKKKIKARDPEIPLDKLLDAREKELEDLRSKVHQNKTLIETLEGDNKELHETVNKLQQERDMYEAKIKTLEESRPVSGEVINDAVNQLQDLVGDLLKDADESKNKVVLNLLPVIYSLMKGK